MKRARVGWLIVLCALAFGVEGLNTAGWWCWLDFLNEVSVDPDPALHGLASSACVALPSTVWWSRQLEPRALGLAGEEAVTAALTRLGELQARWMPSDFNGDRNLARAELVSGDLLAGEARLERALLRDPHSPYLHRLLAAVLRQLGQMDACLDQLAEAEALRSGLRNPPVELTPEDESWVKIEALRRRLELYPRQRVQGLIDLARALRDSGDSEQASEVLELCGDHPDGALERARWAMDEGRFGDAGRLASSLAQRPGLPVGLKVTAWSLASQAADLDGRPEEAEAAAREALRFNASSPAPYLALAAMAERRGDLHAALSYMRTAWGIAPADVNLLLRLAAVAEQAGHQQDARMALERAADIAPEQPRVAALLVDYYLRQGDLMAATMRLSRALERFPTDPGLLRRAEALRTRMRG